MSRGERPPHRHERTPEERDRDRLERERRRAARAGRPLDPPPPVTPPAESAPAEAVQPEVAPPFVDAVQPPPETPPPEAADAPPEPPPAVEPVQLPPEPPPAVEPVQLPPEPPLAVEPVQLPTRIPAAEPTPAMSGVRGPIGQAPHRGGWWHRRERHPTSGRVLAVAALLAAIVAVVVLVVTLSSSSSNRSTGAAPPAVVRVVIPEGSTRLQIAQIAAAKGLRGSYRRAARRSALLDPTRYGAPRGTPDLEGFLFPATYEEFAHASVARLVHDQLVAFRENFGPALVARARALHLTPYQLLIVASMIEREARVSADRPKIAAVIYNRLARGMPLGVDATIYYALELRLGVATYERELTESQLHIDSPYNTRTNTGLPPTPIANPGLASIDAAANPAHVSYLYYVLAADGCGEHVFSSTLAGFEAADAAYRAAVARNHGHPPVCKHK